MSDEKIVNRDCINWSNNDHCAKTKSNYCVKDCKHYRVCGASHTPASVASRLTDGRIMDIAESCDNYHEPLTAAVLRDYVRLRKLANSVKESVSRCDDLATLMVLGKAIGFKETVEEIKRLLAEAEKGEAK